MKKILGLAMLLSLMPVQAIAGSTAAECRQQGSSAGHVEGYRYGRSLGPQLGQGPGSDIEEIDRKIREQVKAEEHAANRQECQQRGFYQDWRNGFEQGFHIGMSEAREEMGPNPLPVVPEPAQPMHSDGERNPHGSPGSASGAAGDSSPGSAVPAN